MEEKLNFESLFAYGREYQTKFDYYFLGIIVSLLALSIQTFNPDENTNLVFLIIISWVLLIISMLAGFFRFERIQVSNHLETQKAYKVQYEGLNPYSEPIKSFHDLINKNGKKALLFYKTEKRCFFAAVLFYFLFKVLSIYL
jgi:hypothetical protein